MLELQRRRFVRDRTQAIQRLRSDWTQLDPVAEAGVAALRPPARAAPAQADPLRRQPHRADRRALHPRARPRHRRPQPAHRRARHTRSPSCSHEHGNPLADLHGAGTNLAATLIAQAGDVRRFRDAAAFARFCGAAPIPCGSGQTAGRHRLHRGGNRQLNAALYRIAIVQQRHHPDAKAFLARKHRRRQDTPRSPPRAQTPPRQRPLPTPPHLGRQHPRHESLDIGESNASSRHSRTNGPTAASTAAHPSAPQRCRLPRPLQLQTTTRLPRPPTARDETDQPHRELQLAQIHSPPYSPGTEPAVVLRHCGRLGAVRKPLWAVRSTEGSNPSPSAEGSRKLPICGGFRRWLPITTTFRSPTQ